MGDIFCTLSALTLKLDEGFANSPNLTQEKLSHVYGAEALVLGTVVPMSTIHNHSRLHSLPMAGSKVLTLHP